MNEPQRSGVQGLARKKFEAVFHELPVLGEDCSAKNLVAAGVASRCEVQLAYAIGVSEPVSVCVDTQGTGKFSDEKICAAVRQVFPLTPSGIIRYLDLRRPIYRRTAAGGHFGRSEPEFTWEGTGKAAEIAKAVS